MKTKLAVLLFFVAALSGTARAQVNNARMLSTPNAQTGTTYTFVAADTTRVVTFNSASAVAATLPNGATFGFGAGTMLTVVNLGAGSVTITCSSCTINGSATEVISQAQGADIYGGAGSPAVNYVALTLGGGGMSGSLANQQIAVGSAPNTIMGSNNFTWTGSIFSIINPTLATNVLNQNSPTISLMGNYWNGAASVPETWTFQIVTGTGPNPVDEYRVTGGSSSGGELFHVTTALTVDGQVNFATTLAMQGTIFTGLIQGALAYQNKGNTAANAGANVSSGAHQFVGECWNGSSSIDAILTLKYAVGTGTNPNTTIGLTPSGGCGGQVIASIPGVMYSCGTIAAGGACVPATSGNSHCYAGIATLSAGASTITGITPAFTSSTSYFVITSDQTTKANASNGTPASGSSITFSGTGTDNLSFVACGE